MATDSPWRHHWAADTVSARLTSFAVDASPPNTAIATAAAGRSQLTNVIAAVVVLVVLVLFTAPLSQLPQATLGATLVYIATKLSHVGELRTILRFDRLGFALAGAALLAVALISIEDGVLLAMVLSLADRIRRSVRPSDTILGREPGTDHWIPVDVGHATGQIPGVLVNLVYAALWYGNADYLRMWIRHLFNAASESVRAVILV